MAAGDIMDGARGGIDLPKGDIDRAKSHLATRSNDPLLHPPRETAWRLHVGNGGCFASIGENGLIGPCRCTDI
jgi:hypothetical protein